MTTVDGSTISECFALVSRVGSELVGLNETLSIMLTDSLNDKSLPWVLAGEVEGDDRTDDSAWVYTDESKYLPLKARGKGKKIAERYLGYQISMTGSGINVLDNLQPLLHVFCWDSRSEFEEGRYLSFPLSEDDDMCPDNIVEGRLLIWNEDDGTAWNGRQWCFSLLLTSLNSPGDLKMHVVEPALALLKGIEVLRALPDSLPALVHYPAIELLMTQEK